MSKETIHYRCGHTGIANLCGNTKDRARRAKWIGETRVCEECEEKEREAANAAAAEDNSAAGLPELDGTPKQISWAESIRKGRIADMETGRKIADLQRRHDDAQTDEEKTAIIREDESECRSLSYEVREALSVLGTPSRYDACMRFLKTQADASWWIEWHRTSMDYIIKQHRKQIDEIEHDAKPMPAELQEIAREEIAEATLRPATEPISHAIAEIKSTGSTIEVHFPEKRDDFRAEIKALGYAWDATISAWTKALGGMTGDATNRIAEVAHRIVGAGFVVRLHNAMAREMAISGGFTPETFRWVYLIGAGKYAGRLAIKWGRTDDVYAAARSLPGAIYVKPCIVVPAGAVEAVAEFAERYGFQMTPGVLAVMGEHRAALAGGAVVTDIKERPAPVRANYDSTPKQLAAPIDAGIDDDLKD